MKINYLFFIFISIALGACNAPNSVTDKNSQLKECNPCGLVFYNVENLFDIHDDPTIIDEEFTPESEKNWTSERYSDKLHKLSTVISAIGEELPAVVGLAEIENNKVIEDLISTGKLKNGNYRIVHENSKDARGIDVALIYRPDYFTVKSFNSIHVSLKSDPEKTTRDILHVIGNFKDGSEVHYFVNRWPSRYGGMEVSEPNRMEAARVLRAKVDEVKAINKKAKILIMGDLNDYPDNKSITTVLKAGNYLSDKTDLFNLMLNSDTTISHGSYNYRGDWGFLDQIIVNKNFIKGKGINVDPTTANAFKEDWMMFQDPKYKDWKPNRTYGGPNYFGGYSDHLPVYVELKN